MPLAGLGSWQSAPGEVEKSIEWALEAGVRLIDTAAMYRNEGEIGGVINKFLKAGKIKRSDLFVVTKLPVMAMRPELVEKYLNKSLKDLGLDFVDLYLVHTSMGVERDPADDWMKFTDGKVMMMTQSNFPSPQYDHNSDVSSQARFETDTDLVGIWREMEKAMDSGKVRSIGVSNWNSEQLERVSCKARIPISVNQIECYAYYQQRNVRKTMEKLGIKVMAYAPLGSPGIADEAY